MKRSPWSEVLGIAEGVKNPTLFQLFGLDERSFDPARVEDAFREQMQRLQGVRSTKHKDFLEFAKGELRRARRVLSDESELAAYRAELLIERTERLEQLLALALASGVLVPKAEQQLLALARELGLSDDETVVAIDRALEEAGARRGQPGGETALSDLAGLTPTAAATLAAADAAKLAKLAHEAAERALEASRAAAATQESPEERPAVESSSAESAEPEPVVESLARISAEKLAEEPAAPEEPSQPEAPPEDDDQEAAKEWLESVLLQSNDPFLAAVAGALRVGDEQAAAGAPPEEPARAPASEWGKKSGRRKRASEPALEAVAPPAKDDVPQVTFCDGCGVSLPARWKKTGEAERVGTRLLCSTCSSPIRAGQACLGCSKPFGDDRAPVAVGNHKLCKACAGRVQRLKVCASCQVVLPKVAFERGEVVRRGGKVYCRECSSG